jgi:hypothetical protein
VEVHKVVKTFEISHFLDNRLTDGGEVVIFTHRSRFTPYKDFPVHIPVRGCITQNYSAARRITVRATNFFTSSVFLDMKT